MAQLPDGLALPGKLFIVEGIDGSGKSTQLDLLSKWLIGQGYCVAFSEWNSSPLVKSTTRKGKKKQMLTPSSFSLIHAADFADRLERQILPALKAGAIVLADRYVYTAFGRDVARGVAPEWVRKVYAFAVKPTVAFYFRVPLEESLRRILGGRPQLKFYEAGMDIGLSDDPYESFALFQGRILAEYDKMVDEFGLTVIDATLRLVEQQELVREIISPLLSGALRAEPSAWREVLAAESVYGRYLDEVLPERGAP
jgi:dTMP kinase